MALSEEALQKDFGAIWNKTISNQPQILHNLNPNVEFDSCGRFACSRSELTTSAESSMNPQPLELRPAIIKTIASRYAVLLDYCTLRVLTTLANVPAIRPQLSSALSSVERYLRQKISNYQRCRPKSPSCSNTSLEVLGRLREWCLYLIQQYEITIVCL